ncbi:MAG: fimbrillin family protein [Alistipes sp.]|nr:fimbrillin family protein [Alistipes sp.]
MKRLLFTLISFALLASCSTDNLGDNAPILATSKISVEVTPEPTRTYTDGSQIFWAESGEQLNIIYYADDNSSSRRQTSTHTDYTLTDNRILFTADFTATDGATSYTLGAFYPYAYKSVTSSISLTVPQEQTPAENSYDPATDILVSTNPVTVQGTPDKVNFTFSRLVAFAKMTLVGIPAGEKIESVVFSSPAKPNGAVEFKVHEQGTLENAKWYNNYEDININLGG